MSVSSCTIVDDKTFAAELDDPIVDDHRRCCDDLSTINGVIRSIFSKSFTIVDCCHVCSLLYRRGVVTMYLFRRYDARLCCNYKAAAVVTMITIGRYC